jgi:large subunit ribosomal protein L25
MTQALSLTITPRAQTGRSASRRVRKVNQIPAILYGKHTKPQTIAIDAPEFTRLLKSVAGRALIIELNHKDSADKALSFIQEIQRDPITDKFRHVDLQEVKANEKLDINVPISIIGEAYGVKTQGGVLETSAHTLRVRCLPKDLPPVIVIDVSELKINESLKVAGLKPIAGVEFRDTPGQPVVGVLSIAVEEVAAPAATAAAGAAAPAAGAAGAAPAAGAAAKPGDATAPAAGAKPGDAKAAAPAAKGAAKK